MCRDAMRGDPGTGSEMDGHGWVWIGIGFTTSLRIESRASTGKRLGLGCSGRSLAINVR